MEKRSMAMSKRAGFILLAGVAGMLLGVTMHAQNPAGGGGSAAARVDDTLPKDIYPESRNRLPLPKREEMDDEGKKAFDEWSTGLQLSSIARAPLRLYSPKLAQPLDAAHHYVKYETALGVRLTEIAVLVASRETDCQFEWTNWEIHGHNPGDPRYIEPAIVDIIKYDKPVAGLGEKETVIIDFGRELFDQRKVSSETFAHALRLFGPRGTVDLTELMALYSQTAAELDVFDMQMEPGQKPLLPPRPYSAKCPATRNQTLASGDDPLPKDVYADSRNRLPLLKRENMDDYGKQVFDKLSKGPGFTPPLRYYSPKLAESMSATHYYLKFGTGLPDRLVEIAVLVTAREFANQFEWTQWETFARKQGDPRYVEPAIIDMIKYDKPVAGLGEKETVIIDFGRELFGQRKVSSETFAHVLRLFGRRGTVDLTELMAMYFATGVELNAFDQQLMVGQKLLLPAGTVPGYCLHQ
jgi:4-carboxymuconolactone decarboxylase